MLSTTHKIHGNVLTPQGWLHGKLLFDTKIAQILPDNPLQEPSVAPFENEDNYILPGFIDLHVHGGGGKDTMQAGDAVQIIARTHARYGTTSLLATTMTAPFCDIHPALAAIGLASKQRAPGAARVLGAHLEGPFIHPGKLGAQPNYTCTATLAAVQELALLAPLRLITLAPEIPGHTDLIRALSQIGIRVQIGHTAGSYEDGVAALACGASGFTHLFNAMSGFHHREPGMAGAALAHAEYAEIIPDLLHVHPGAVKAALRAIPRLYCVTDSTAATDMPDGEYMLGRMQVNKCMGGVRLADGTLAGSTLTMDQALRNLVTLGLSLADASNRVSTYAADYLGMPERGRIHPGSMADIVVLDRHLRLKAVYIEGEIIEPAPTNA